MTERIQKLLAAAGLCSRRTAEEWIAAGRVTVNGRRVRVGDKADPETDDIRVDGRPLRGAAQHVYLMLHKPRGYVTTLSDEFGRRTAAELIESCGARVFPVGRLDMDSEGLLLFTNDGELMQQLIHPKYEVDKLYRVTVRGNWNKGVELLQQMRLLEGEPIAPARVEVLRRTGGTAELSITIHEGKNRQVRRMCSACGVTVKRLQRIREHTLELGTLGVGKWRYLTEDEYRALARD